MSYIWQDFNIKPIRAETVVFRDGVFCPEFSTLDSPIIDKKYDLPIHFIYVGEIRENTNFDIIINENVKNQVIYLSGKVIVKNSVKLDVCIKNNGFSSDLRGFFIIENHGNLTFNLDAYHLCRNTGIFIETRLLAYKNTISKLSGTAHIYKYCENCRSNIDFSALADENAKITFMPVQKISAIPEDASHSASIAHYTQPQIEYLHTAGLSDIEVRQVLRDAFIGNIDIFK